MNLIWTSSSGFSASLGWVPTCVSLAIRTGSRVRGHAGVFALELRNWFD